MKSILGIAFFLFQLALAVPTSAAPSFPLHISSNGRYLVDSKSAPFLIQGDTAWQLLVTLKREDVEYYLENRRQKGFNAIIVNLIETFYGPNPPRNPYGAEPFTIPGDFSTPNESYFAHVDWVLSKAAEKGIVVFLNPAYLGFDAGDAEPNDGWWLDVVLNGPGKNRNYGRYLGNRYKNFTNIVWTAGGDRNPAAGSTGEQNALEILRGIKEVAPSQLWTGHWSNTQDSLDEPAFQSYMDLDGVYTYEGESGFVHERMLRAYSASNSRPIYLYESKYETTGIPREKVRRQQYEADLSGSTGQFFGSNYSSFDTPSWQEQLESPGCQDMLRLIQLMANRHWYNLVPDGRHDLVVAGYGTFGTTDYVTAARTSDGSLAMAYISSTGTGSRTITVNISQLSGAVTAQWYNPTDGTYAPATSNAFFLSQNRSFTTPGDNGTGENDWVLILQTAPPANPYSIIDLGATSGVTLSGATSAQIGYARIQPESGGTAPSALAVLGFGLNGILVSETAIPSSALLTSGRLYVEISADGTVNTGLAIANPNSQPAGINFTFTESNGKAAGSGMINIGPQAQVVQFLNAPPYNGGTMQGTFAFQSTAPVSVVALRGLVNKRGEFLMTTLPLTDASAPANTGTQFLPYFADGNGWTTQVVLVNPTDSEINGHANFLDSAGQPLTLTVNGNTTGSAAYSIPGRGSRKFLTSGDSAALTTGSVQIVPADGGVAPTSQLIFINRSGEVTLSQASVSAVPGTSFRLYIESQGVAGEIGNIKTGVAIANTAASSTVVTLELFDATGALAGGPTQLTLPANGQMTGFVTELFPGLPVSFRGVLRVSTPSSRISVIGIRGRMNERRDLLMTTVPPIVETNPANAGDSVLPYIVAGAGYTSQIILFSGTSGQSGSGQLQFLKSDGTPLYVTLK